MASPRIEPLDPLGFTGKDLRQSGRWRLHGTFRKGRQEVIGEAVHQGISRQRMPKGAELYDNLAHRASS